MTQHLSANCSEAKTHTLWTYRWTPMGGVQKISYKEYDSFYRGTTSFPVDTDPYVYVVQFAVGLSNRKPVSLCKEWYIKHRQNLDGTIDNKHCTDAHRVAMDMAFGDLGGERSRDIIGARRMAQRRNAAIHSWEPTTEVVQELARILVKRGVPDLR